MPESYGEAALRHWRDAELLKDKNRLENADQLYGFAAECALKTVMSILPVFSKESSLYEQYKEHINVLWSKANHQSLQKRAVTLPALLKAANPFSDWDVNQRYAADGTVPSEVMSKHRAATKRLMGSVGLVGARKK